MYKKISLIFILTICFFYFISFNFLNRQGKIILIGVDGATWKAINPMIERGELPNIKKLIDSGCYGELATDCANSPVSWTSIITGKGKEKHGVDHEKLPRLMWTEILEIKTNRLWDILLYEGKKVGVYRWFFTDPCRVINGFWVSFRGFSSPEIMVEFPNDDFELELIYLLDRYSCDFVSAFWYNVDKCQHAYWLYHIISQEIDLDILPLKIKKDINYYAEEIYSSYRTFDYRLGKLLKYLGKNDSIIIVSDHGMSLLDPCDKKIRIRKNLLPKLGISEGWLDEDERLAQGTLRGVRFKVEIQEAPAYIPPIFSCEMLKEYKEDIRTPLINIVFNREIVDERDHESVQKEIIDILENIKQDGINIFNLKEKGLYELTFELSKETRAYCEKIREVTYTEFLEIDVITGGHGALDAGIIILNGRRFKENYQMQGAHLYDVTPTILHLMNLPVGKDMDGKVLKSVFRPSIFTKVIKYIDSYDDYIPIAENDVLEQRVASEEEKRRLRSLGYIQ